MEEKTYDSTIIVGALVEESVANAFSEKCKPNTTSEIIEAFIRSIVSNELSIQRTEVNQYGRNSNNCRAGK